MQNLADEIIERAEELKSARLNFEKLWQEVFNADEKEMVDYCRSKGIDVLDDAKKPVPGWRDIAVMLKAVDTKLIERA